MNNKYWNDRHNDAPYPQIKYHRPELGNVVTFKGSRKQKWVCNGYDIQNPRRLVLFPLKGWKTLLIGGVERAIPVPDLNQMYAIAWPHSLESA